MAYTDKGQGYDVAIGGLPFKLAINGERPYERATAQFRKEQFDSAPTVGDQSLTGWWTRGQLSFHKGAGITYYEVLDGETVLERYNDSDSLEVFTPGKVTLLPSLTDMSLGALDAVPAPLSRGGGVYVLTDTGIEYTAGSTSQAIDTSDSGVPTSITSSGDLFYVTNATKIEQQFDGSLVRTNHVANPSFETNTTGWDAVTGTSLAQTNYVTNPSFETNTTGWAPTSAQVRTNLCGNPSFESNTTSWSGGGSVPPTLSRVSTRSVVGANCLQIAWGTGGTVPLASITISGLTVGREYTASAYVYVPSGDPDIKLVMNATHGTAVSTKGEWVRVSVTLTASGTSHALQVWPNSSPTSGDLAFVDAVLVEEGAGTPGPYFDGATADGYGWDYGWTGSTNNSTSLAVVASTYVRTNQITNPSAETNTTGWTGANGTLTRGAVGGAALEGSAYFRLEKTGGPTVGMSTATGASGMPIVGGRDYYLRAGFRPGAGFTAGATARIRAQWYDAAGVQVDFEDIDITTLGTVDVWMELDGTATAPLGAVYLAVNLLLAGPGAVTLGANGIVMLLDRIMVTENATSGYFDGDTADGGGITYAWTGSDDNSTSTSSQALGADIDRVSTRAQFGSWSLHVDDALFGQLPVGTSRTVSGLTNGVTYVVSGWVYLASQDYRVRMTVDDAGGTVDTSTTTGSWEELSGSFTASGTSAVLTFEHTGHGVADEFWLDGVMVTEAPWTDGYFDGSFADGSITYAWSGTVHGSTSTATDSTATIISRVTDQAKYGTRSLLVEDEHAREVGVGVTYTLTGLADDTDYTVLAWVYVTAGGTANVEMTVDGGAALATTATTGAWELLTAQFTSTETTHDLEFNHTASSDAMSFYIDAILWTEDPYLGDYFDGAQPGASWVGTPHASKSIYAGGSDDATAALITITGDEWDRVFWAKGRVFAVSDDGDWFALPAVVDTVSAADRFWGTGRDGVNWSLTEGTGPVYISDGFDIYTVTVDTDGVVPVITTPTTAARMPLGEEISCISYYLGYLIIATSRGVRVAQTQENQVLLGPLVIEGDFSKANRIGAFNTQAYVVGRLDDRDGDAVLCTIDLSQFITDLVPAWSPRITVSDLASTASGVVVDSGGRRYVWAAEELFVTSLDSRSASGYLETGFHRFGTLEPKHFLSVLVRTGGTGGTIAVSLVAADGTETLLETIAVPAGTTEVPLGLTEPAEMVGLKFTLTRSATDPTVGPELLGYQLRALPAPRRQRMIRLPLELKDIERRGGSPALGYVGSAWDRLAALEDMEETGSVVSFVDQRTGEEVTVSVESIEHKGVTPPGGNSNGYGGIVWVTLRKIA